MNLEKIVHIISLFSDKPMPKEIFETLYHEEELKLFFQKDEQNDLDSLKWFITTKGDNTMPLIVTSGTATVPTNFHRVISGYHITGGQQYLINFVDAKEFDRLINHAIEYPTEEYAIANIGSTTIRVRPVGIRHIRFTYLELPQKITYAVTSTRGYQVFDETNSSTVKWDDTNALILIQYILQSIGIQATIEQINQKQKEK